MILKNSLFKFAFTHLIICTALTDKVVVIASDFTSSLCTAELESKFLQKDGRCRYGGLLPVKGSCTSYIPCISFGGDLMKPLKQAECSKTEVMAFDVEYLRCRPVQQLLKTCPQRECYPEESKLLDRDLLPDETTLNATDYEDEPIVTIRPFLDTVSISTTDANNNITSTLHSISSSTASSISTMSGIFQSAEHFNCVPLLNAIAISVFASLTIN